MALVLLHVGDDEPEIRSDQSFCCFFVSRLRPSCEPTLFFSVGYEWELLDVL